MKQQITHSKEEVHNSVVQKGFPPRLSRLQHDILSGFKHGNVMSAK